MHIHYWPHKICGLSERAENKVLWSRSAQKWRKWRDRLCRAQRRELEREEETTMAQQRSELDRVVCISTATSWRGQKSIAVNCLRCGQPSTRGWLKTGHKKRNKNIPATLLQLSRRATSYTGDAAKQCTIMYMYTQHNAAMLIRWFVHAVTMLCSAVSITLCVCRSVARSSLDGQLDAANLFTDEGPILPIGGRSSAELLSNTARLGKARSVRHRLVIGCCRPTGRRYRAIWSMRRLIRSKRAGQSVSQPIHGRPARVSPGHSVHFRIRVAECDDIHHLIMFLASSSPTELWDVA